MALQCVHGHGQSQAEFGAFIWKRIDANVMIKSSWIFGQLGNEIMDLILFIWTLLFYITFITVWILNPFKN